jgi:hypothetical protein
MDLAELLDMLDIEDAGSLEYFEQYAELAETDTDIPEETLAEFFDGADADVLRELTDAYFEEILSGVPDDRTEFYLLITNIGRVLSGLVGEASGGSDDGRRPYADEFYRFKCWYTTEACVVRGGERLTVLDALATIRAEKLTGGADDEFDFSEALDYEMDEYAVSLSELIDE